MQDAVLRAAADLQLGSTAPGLPAGSLPQSKAAALARAQQQLKAQSGLRSLHDDDGDDDEQEEDEEQASDRYDGGASSSHRQQQLLGSGSSSGSGVLRRAARGLPAAAAAAAAAADSYSFRRRMPDLLDYLECTKPAADDSSSPGTAAAAAPPAARGLFNALSKLGSSASSSSSAALAAASAGPLSMSVERLSALVCRNALFELCQDLVTASIRGEQPASLAGIWPLLTLFNHSCAPNSVAVTIGHQPPPSPKQPHSLLAAGQQQARLGSGRGPVNPWAVQAARTKPGRGSSSSSNSSSGGTQLATADAGLTFCAQAGHGPFVLVRSVTDLKPGDEVSLDYLSAGIEGSLVHQERRRAALAERWGFTCRCVVGGLRHLCLQLCLLHACLCVRAAGPSHRPACSHSPCASSRTVLLTGVSAARPSSSWAGQSAAPCRQQTP
jgi:hypothetical protein